MGTLAKGAVVAGIISIVLGIISRLILKPIFVEAQAYLQFAQTCFLLAIAVLLLEKK